MRLRHNATAALISALVLSGPAAQAAEEFDESGFDAGPGDAPPPTITTGAESLASPHSGGAADYPRLGLFSGGAWSTWARDTVDENHREERWEGLHEMRLNGEVAVNARWSARVGGRLLHYFTESASRGSESLYEPDLMEAYLRWSQGPVDIQAGQQSLVWGRTELLSPLDNVTPKDYRFLTDLDPDRMNLPLPMLRTDAYFGPVSGQVFWIPFHRESRLFTTFHDNALMPPGSEAFALLGHFNPRQRQRFSRLIENSTRPPDDLSASEFGGRLQMDFDGWDIGLSTLDSHVRVPVLLAPSFMPAGGELPPELPEEVINAFLDEAEGSGEAALAFPRRAIYGLDFSAALGGIVINMDLAWQRPMHVYTRDLRVLRRDGVAGVVALEYMRGDTLFLNLQYFHWAVPGLENEDSVLIEPNLKGMTAFVRWEPWPGRLTVEARGAVVFNQQAGVFSPRLIWNLNSSLPGLSWRWGANVFEAPDSEVLAVLDPNDQVYTTLAFVF